MSDISQEIFHQRPRSKTPTWGLDTDTQEQSDSNEEVSGTTSEGISTRPRPSQQSLNRGLTSTSTLPLNPNLSQSAMIPPSSHHTPASSRIGLPLPHAKSFLSLVSKSNTPAPIHSHFGTDNESTLREADRVGRAPSTEQMVEGLQVHMMQKSSRDPISPQFNAHVFHLLEDYNKIQEELCEAKKELWATKEQKERDKVEFAAISNEWQVREEQYGKDIKHLEHIVADKVQNGLANVALARSNSAIRRGGKTDKAGREIRERVRVLLENRDEEASPAAPGFLPSEPDMNPAVRYRVRLGDDQLKDQDLERVSTIKSTFLDSPGVEGATATRGAGANYIQPTENPPHYHGPRIQPSPRLINPGHDFLISERLRHGLPVMAAKQAPNARPGRLQVQLERQGSRRSQISRGTAGTAESQARADTATAGDDTLDFHEMDVSEKEEAKQATTIAASESLDDRENREGSESSQVTVRGLFAEFAGIRAEEIAAGSPTESTEAATAQVPGDIPLTLTNEGEGGEERSTTSSFFAGTFKTKAKGKIKNKGRKGGGRG